MIYLILLVGTMAVGVPIFVALAIPAVVFLFSSDLPLNLIPHSLYTGVDLFPLIAVPCFMLAGFLMERGGLTVQIVEVMAKCVGRLPGGLGVITIFASAFFATLNGSGPATTAAIGALMIPAMVAQGYRRDLAAAVASAGGTLGVMIPPSNPMIVYGAVGGVSITTLFMAGVLPGLLITVLLITTTLIICRRVDVTRLERRGSWRDVLVSAYGARFALFAPVLILGGIYGGIFTPVEASVVAVMYALVVGALITRRLSVSAIIESIGECSVMTGSITVVVGTGALFGKLMATYQVPERFATYILGLTTTWWLVLGGVIIMLLVIGMFMDTLVTVIILTPILLPVMKKIGVDPILFGILFVVTSEIAFIHPPLGLNLFVASALAGTTIERVSVTVIPYVVALLVAMLVLVLVPEVVFLLPRWLGAIR
jgi:C4-dicarboxylate transporter DctM subunit